MSDNNLPEMKWAPMVVLSVIFHLVVVLAVMFIPDSIPAKHVTGTIFEIDLVTLPSPAGSKQPEPVSESRPLSVPAKIKEKTTPTRVTPEPKKEEKPLIVAKKTLQTKDIKPPPKTSSPTQLIDQAISKIEDKVKKEEQGSHLDQALRELEKKMGDSDQPVSRAGDGRVIGSRVAGISESLYQMEVETHIKSNWSYPVALRDSDTLEATLVIRVRNTGEIINIQFKKRSPDSTFNDSVWKAIERSDPLPPFPETFRKREEELEINFNLRDLKV